MKEVTITIEWNDIIGRIFAESGYAALARAKAGLPEQFTDILQVTEDDRRILKGYIRDSINEAAVTISRYLAPCSVKFIGNAGEEESLVYLTFTPPHNYPDRMLPALKECISALTVSRCLQYWVLTVKPDEANIHISKAQGELLHMRELLSARTRPVKESGTDDNIIEM